MFYRIRVSLIMSLCLVALISSSQQKWPNTLLWRISGNGLAKPSYLYGTMHLQDKRLFQFTDSLYHSLENTEGFALEIDFNELMDSVFTRSFHDAESEVLERQRVKLNKKKLDKSADSILKIMGIKGDEVTKKDLKKIRDYRMNKLIQQGEMKTIVDGYLYGLALRMGKWIGGIEDVVDQLDLIDELGADLTPDEVFQPETNLRRSLDEMMKIYIGKDLQSLADYVDGNYNQKYKDAMLIHRNVKMARRMDSLSKFRTMFFAVGAAHLPGDSGVISLLRKRGFTVEPVFSPQSISPEAYASKLNAIPWETVDADLYSIQMPGKASEYNMFGEIMKMKVFFDLATMTFYMSGSTIGGNGSLDNSDKLFQSMADRMGSVGNKIKPKDVSINGVKGKEASFDITEGSYNVKLLQRGSTIYLLMAGSSKKSNLTSPDVSKFFSSFKAREIAVDEKRWTRFSIPGKGFTIELPGEPKVNKSFGENQSQWEFTTYDIVDNAKGLYYLFQVRDIKAGFYIQNDSLYFAAYKEDILKGFEKILGEEWFIFKGYPAYKMELSLKGTVRYVVHNVIRGNRVYLLAVGGDKNADFSDAEHVFNSLEFENYSSKEWKNYQVDGFNITAPAPVKKMKKDSSDSDVDAVVNKNTTQHFVAFDPEKVISYEIFKIRLSPYYWIKNDSLYFEKQLDNYVSYEDSVLQKRMVYNGNLKGMELIIQQKGRSTLQKMRLLVNGDTLYNLLSFLPQQELEDESKKFFEDFRILNEAQPTIYTKKTRQLLDALKTKDTTEFSEALSAFQQVSFEKDDLPLLHQALLETYIQRAEDYQTINDRIVNVLDELADASTVKFVSDNYKKLDQEKEALKYTLLELLSKIKTTESYGVLKNLLLAGLPSKGAPKLTYALRDSLQLTLSLYPEILSLSKDSLFSNTLVDVTKELLDSSLILLKEVHPYEQNFLKNAERNLRKVQKDEEEWWMVSNWIPFIAKFNDKESNDLVREFLKLKETGAKYAAVLALVKNNQAVNPFDIEKVAEDKMYRKDLYDELKTLNKLKLFPAKYATQLKIAESEIFILSDDDQTPSAVTFIGERVTTFMEKKQKFYLFKVDFKNEESYSYLGITGPYSLTSKEIVISSGAAGGYWDEEFDKRKIEEQFKEYLSSTEEYLKKKDQPSKETMK